MTVGELSRRMSSRELSEWQAEASLRPLGLERIELMLAKVCQVVMASAGASPVPDLDKFLLFAEPPPEQTVEQLRAAAGLLHRS